MKSLLKATGVTTAIVGALLCVTVGTSEASTVHAADKCYYRVKHDNTPIRDNPDTNSKILGRASANSQWVGPCIWAYDQESGHWFVDVVYDGDNDPHTWIDVVHLY